MTEAIYERDGDWYVPNRFAGGPWSPDSQHGGPPSALLAGAIESVASPGMLVARVTVEILKPVQMVPHRIETEVLRPGKRVQLIGARLLSAEGEIARATALRIRRDPDVTQDPLHTTPQPDPPQAGEIHKEFGGFRHFFADAIEVRYLSGAAEVPGPATAWIRMAVPLVADEEPSQLQRVVVAADTGNGISAELDFRGNLFINPDLTVYLHRLPAGEWICLDSVTNLGEGTGLAQSALYDQQGPIGRSLQALYVDRS
jgi:hypothetical protein